MLRELVALFIQAAADKGLRLTLDLDAELPDAVWLDAQRLRQILINLIGNAVNFTDAGTIRLHALAEPSGPDRVRLRISIQDSGPGIDNALLGSIFEPFEQISRLAHDRGKTGAGLGLGLSISRRLARLMGGEIAVESRPGHGSCFTLELPETTVVPLAPDTAPSGVVVSPTNSAQPGATHLTRDPTHTSGRDRLQAPPAPPATDASAEAVVSRLPADLREPLRSLRPPLTSINAIEGFIELLSARARELDDVDLRRIAEELREAADAFDLPALGAGLDRLGNPSERAALNDRSASAPNAGGARRRILVVDDEQAGLRLAGRLLLEQGFEVFAALDGATAIEIARAVTPGLVLLDLAMPGIDGLATCAALKESPATRAIPVIFLTGRADEPSLLDAFEVGASDYVVKPFEPRVLLARVRAHFELARLSRDLEGALSERTHELKAANDRLRHLAMALSLSEDRERSRLAGALHDGPMQKFALAQIQIDALLHPRREMAASEPRTDEPGDAALALMNEAIAELRTLQFDLSPSVLRQRGLAAALEWLAESMSRRSG
ncbi:MAG: response regulator, partial [Candidatus Competibacteraceae bacterium]|nr:response regulator [Candidatus Competibacteraceae bacterium]